MKEERWGVERKEKIGGCINPRKKLEGKAAKVNLKNEDKLFFTIDTRTVPEFGASA